MKMQVFNLNFWLKRSRGRNNDKNEKNTIIQIRDKTANATQDQVEFER